ncbi:hypothetical protein B0I35DRAFT_425754 [Stachybotrys elegans]|uniref:Uncharacterized protein n=1 Tax=Stachybotrys elegans TaxID=80388 RepID=A0A8K0T0A4_9HYPO|nr:hypothetical protein B0I35DRAFT_425754 [Stachybotrys elegans]
MATSIIDSFAEALPWGDRNITGPVSLSDTDFSRSPTAPVTCLEEPIDTWLQLGRAALGRAYSSGQLSNSWLATWEPSRYLRTEGDVTCASSPQLMNPVDLVLSASHQTSIRVLNEATSHKAGRPDRVWDLAAHGQSVKHFAVLDYKRIGSLKKDDFRPRLSHYEHARRHNDFSAQSWPDDNANKVLRIATAYAKGWKTRYVAMFDWDLLILLVMERAHGSDGGEWCRVTFVHDRPKMRLALLGFLEGAYLAATQRDTNHLQSLSVAQPTTPRSKSDRHTGSHRPDYQEVDEDGNPYHSPSPRHYRTGSSSQYYQTKQSGRHESIPRTAAYQGDFGMSGLTLDPRRMTRPSDSGGAPRNKSRDARAVQQTSSQRKEPTGQMNPFTPLSQRPGYSERPTGYERPRY